MQQEVIYQRYIKRFLDLFVAAALFALLFWFVVLIGLAYLIINQWPLFFFQFRIGEKNKPFSVCKFRTLAAQEDKPLQARRFLLGDFLRGSNLDELPQLWNILKGDMSLIGPRPLPVEYLALMNDDQKRRHLVLPGITGWAQVNGRHSISWQKKFELDIYYVDHISFRLDMLILFKTIVLLLSFKKDKSLVEEKFKGN